MIDRLRTLETESRRFAEALGQAAPDAGVPTCPGWTADDLAWHLAQVHDFWARVLATGAVTDEQAEALEESGPARPDDRTQIMAVFEDATARLIAELAARPDDAAPAWFWLASDRTVGATRRMQALEATMHRVDAEAAAGLASAPLEPELARDAVAHAFDVMWSWWGTQPGFDFVPGPERVALVATDGGSWLAEPGRWQGVGQSGKVYDVPGVRLVRDGAPDSPEGAAARVEGTAEALARWLWGRGPEPVVSGSDTALAPLRQARDEGMQ